MVAAPDGADRVSAPWHGLIMRRRRRNFVRSRLLENCAERTREVCSGAAVVRSDDRVGTECR